MYEIGFTGTQRGMTSLQYSIVTRFLETYKDKIYEVHHGDCIGADAEFHDICNNLGFDITIHPPKNESKRAFKKGSNSRPKKEYLERNHDIVDDSDIMLVCPKEKNEILRSGTWSTYRYAKKRHKKIVLILPNGKIK